MTPSTRRRFLIRSSSAAIATFGIRTSLKSQETKPILRHASVGGGGQAQSDLRDFVSHPNLKLVAVADVDTTVLDNIRKQYPEARLYQDWREMKEKEADNIDSFNVTTPDHMHAAIAASFMELGKHAYVQKPLAQTILETRYLALLAEKKNLVTQMGTQIASTPGNIRVVELIHQGAIGKLRSAYLWSGKSWGDANPLPDRTDPVPPSLNWEEWLGVATDRPYISGAYHPAEWRKRTDFGTGTLGDMGCHIFHPVFAALKLTSPISVKSNGPKPLPDSWAVRSNIDYVFPGNDLTEKETIDFHWYDGGEKVPEEIIAMLGKAISMRVPDQGSIIVGSKGLLLCPHVGLPMLAPFETMGKTAHPKMKPRSHYHEFVEAALGNKAELRSPFSYASKLTESVLLGCLASRFPGETLEWNAEKMVFSNKSEADAFVTRTCRAGWEIPNLPKQG